MISHYIDVHCHLDLIENIPEAISKARKVGVRTIITQGNTLDSNRKALALAEEYREVKAALGLYPLDALQLTDNEVAQEMRWIEKQMPLALGEIGLEFKETPERERQTKIFKEFVSLSLKIKRPMIIHSRKAEKEVVDILLDMKAKQVLMHCFCGKFSLVDEIVKQGWYLSIPASVKYSKQFQDVVSRVPLGSLMCETDSPYLHPEREEKNEPALVVESYKMIAKIKKLPLKEVKENIAKNVGRLFKAN